MCVCGFLHDRGMAGATDGAVGVGVGLHAAVDDVLSPYHRRMYTAARAAAGNFFWFAGVVNNDNVMITKHPPPNSLQFIGLVQV